MSGPKAKDNTKWIAFAERHRSKTYSIVFNGLLDAVIADEDAPLFARVLFWLIRNAWGNFSDWPVNFKTGLMKKQADCARDLKLKDAKGEPDRRKVNPVFQELKDLGYVRFERQAIILIDDPAEANFANSSNSVGKGATLGEENGKIPSFQSFIDEIWAAAHPVEFTEYQETAQRYKELRTGILSEWNAFKEAASDRGTTNGEERPEGERHGVREGTDTPSKREATTGAAILIGSKPSYNVASTSPSSSSGFLVLREAFAQYGLEPDDDLLSKKLIAKCRDKAPDVTHEEIAHFIHTKAKLLHRKKLGNPAAYLVAMVVQVFDSPAPLANLREEKQKRPKEAAQSEPTREERIAALEELCKMTKHPQHAEFKRELEELRAQNPKAKSQKAGQ